MDLTLILLLSVAAVAVTLGLYFKTQLKFFLFLAVVSVGAMVSSLVMALNIPAADAESAIASRIANPAPEIAPEFFLGMIFFIAFLVGAGILFMLGYAVKSSMTPVRKLA